MKCWCSVFLLVFVAVAARADNYRFPVDEINDALNCIFIDTSDVSFRPDRVDLDSFRLTLIDDLTLRPLEIPDFLNSRSRLLLNTECMPSELLDTMAAWLDLYVVSKVISASPGGDLVEFYPMVHEGGAELLEIAKKAMLLSLNMDRARELTKRALEENLTSPERAFVADTFSTFLLEEEDAVNLTVEQHDSLQKANEVLALGFKDFGHKVPLGEIIRAQAQVVVSFEELLQSLERNERMLRALSAEEVRRFLPPVRIRGGIVAFGSSADDRYTGPYQLIIDFGGNDDYYVSSDNEARQQIIIDLSGNDRYVAQSDFTLGGALLGCGILADLEGDDYYQAGHFSLGCGIFGCGLLIDESGDDHYVGDICTQGAGAFGIGLLLDGGGNDIYESCLFSQGFGFIKGVGALVDSSGNDEYRAGWKYGDVLRYENHYISLSQGFGYGLRPHFSGGIGLLIDGAGHDTYNADIFGQGASYWFALGGLVDFEGTDRYVAHQYAQGSATHLCLAALIDADGPDLYASKGVSQGCGHDLAYGLLLDCGGDDQYYAYDLSQAAGSANGVGMQIDLAGNDGYLVRARNNTHGYGNPRREYGSIGLLLDLDGSDIYSGYGADDSYWVTDSKWGIGVDKSRKKDVEE